MKMNEINKYYCKKNVIYPFYEDEDNIKIYATKEDFLLKYNLEEKILKKVFFEIKDRDFIINKINENFSDDIDMSFKSEENFSEEDLGGDSHIARVLNSILDNSIKNFASDIHIEVFKDRLIVRQRIDGELAIYKEFQRKIYSNLISRIKIIAKLDISEKRLPQDGRFSYKFLDKNIDIRVATAPTSYGEKVVLRILDIDRISYTPEGIGLSGENLKIVDNLINQPSGLILCCGPTSSGKSSTIYTLLNRIKSNSLNIMTIEDPIEYRIDGINQIEVNEKTGLNFERGLSSILRMDPDKILIGEIRNKESAQIAISASITGHLVFSTLHTQNSPASIARLIDMGIEPYLVSSGLVGVISQRLIKKLCPHCKKEYFEKSSLINKMVFKKSGCDKCHNGYLGRIAVFEIMPIDENIREKITNKASVRELREIAKSQGMKTLSDEIINLVCSGVTSMEEYYRNIHTVGEYDI